MFESERSAMVRHQLRRRGIIDERVLEAMEKVERHLFVSEEDRDCAYEDRPLLIEAGQTISQPYIVALMTQNLWLAGDEKVLEIGTGSGYQTAILAELAGEVYSIERIPKLSKRASKILEKLKYNNIKLKVGDGTLGWLEAAPFDRILVTAAAPQVPRTLFKQLGVGGRMVVPVGSMYSQELNLVIKRSDCGMEVLRCGGCIFVPLVGNEGWKVD